MIRAIVFVASQWKVLLLCCVFGQKAAGQSGSNTKRSSFNTRSGCSYLEALRPSQRLTLRWFSCSGVCLSSEEHTCRTLTCAIALVVVLCSGLSHGYRTCWPLHRVLQPVPGSAACLVHEGFHFHWAESSSGFHTSLKPLAPIPLFLKIFLSYAYILCPFSNF